ncbi:hypothetical protein VNI00_013871 [Paramarasmius palmivorus]|uniref:Uncharacterized protein n=1 Tax=Paramarasmius palmivorus TaxID=297713 RepID=A0AAW0BUP7_9AGAR
MLNTHERRLAITAITNRPDHEMSQTATDSPGSPVDNTTVRSSAKTSTLPELAPMFITFTDTTLSRTIEDDDSLVSSTKFRPDRDNLYRYDTVKDDEERRSAGKVMFLEYLAHSSWYDPSARHLVRQ